MYTMYEILEIEESISSPGSVKHDSTHENLQNHMIFIDGNLDPCDELMYRSSSGCELMEAEIGSSIGDNLLDVNFMKSDSSLDQMNYFHSDSTQKLNEHKLEIFDESHEEQIVTSKTEVQDDVIVEEVAEEEVMSELPDQYDTELEETIFKIKSRSFSAPNGLKRIRSFNNSILFHPKKLFKCSKCEKIFRRKNNLEYHVCSHDSEELDNSETTEILRETRKISNNVKTKKIRLPSQVLRPNFPKITDLRSRYPNKLDSINEYMSDHQKYKCLYCDGTFPSHMSVTEHSRMEHGIHCDRFVCLYCGKQCKDLRGLQKHSKVHLGGELLLCNTCGKQFYTKNRLKRHMLSHRDKAVVCEECGEKTTDHRAMANHRSSHHVISSRSGTLTTRTFPCYACNKVFGSRSSQQIHMRIHTGERPYSCKYCVKAFADGGTLRKHERIHTGEKPYVCPICQKAFNQRVVLREHIRAHHAGPTSNAEPSKFAYKCAVCSVVCSSSQELCSHLVKHSDDNTAKHRTGAAIGSRPRKYKKWKQLVADDVVVVDKSAGRAGSSVDGGVAAAAVAAAAHRHPVVAATRIAVTAAADLAKSLNNLSNDESFCILAAAATADEDSFDGEVQCAGSGFISPLPPSPTSHPPSGDEEEEVCSMVSEFDVISADQLEYDEGRDQRRQQLQRCSLFVDQMELQKWKRARSGDVGVGDSSSSTSPSSFAYQLLVPFDDKLSDECSNVVIRDSSCGSGIDDGGGDGSNGQSGSTSSFSDTCLNLMEIAAEPRSEEENDDAYFENSHYAQYTASAKTRLRFSLKEKCDYTAFDSDFCMYSGLGLGAIVELT